jgi:hypothetical protein
MFRRHTKRRCWPRLCARYLDWNYGATNLPRPNVTGQFRKVALLGNLFATLHKHAYVLCRKARNMGNSVFVRLAPGGDIAKAGKVAGQL